MQLMCHFQPEHQLWVYEYWTMRTTLLLKFSSSSFPVHCCLGFLYPCHYS